MTAALTRIKHPRWASWLAWDFGTRRTLIGGCVQSLLYFTDMNRGGVWFLALDIAPANAGDKEPLSQHQNRGGWHRIPVETYFPSPVEISQPPPVVIPDPPDGEPVEPPVVEPPPIIPPIIIPPITPQYTIKIEHPPSSVAVLVGNWLEPGKAVKLISPTGNTQTTTTGSKPEHGAGGFEAGYIIVVGNYKLVIDGNEFIIPCDGKFTRVSFERVTEPLPDTEQVIATGFMDISKAQRVLAAANEIARRVVGRDVFRIEV